jgi:hypothetical protein
MQRKEIIDAYLFLRKNNQSIPDDTLEFIKDASLVRFDALFGDCKNCKQNGNQMIYPSGCTGCGPHDEFRNFTPIA